MGTGAKIAIGCGVAILVTGVAAIVGVVGVTMWGKSKLDAFAAEQKAVEELEKKADANPFTVPEDGVIQEARLVKFIEARQRVHPVYETYRAEFEGLQNVEKKKQPDLSDIGKAVKAGAGFLELRKVQLQALADLGMSREEYRYLVQAVYQSWWAAEIEKSTGKTVGENTAAAQDSMKEAARQLEEQSRQPIDPNLPPEAQKAMREAQEQMRQSQRQLEHSADEVDQHIPPQNIALFRKYEADIKKYAMTGLEALTF